MTYRIRNIMVAVALALVAALLTTFYVSNYKRRVQQGESNVRVYVAAQDIPAGTTGAAAFQKHLIEPRDVIRRSVVPGAISNPDQVTKLAATQPVYAGEQITLRRFGTQSERGLRGELKGTLRAFQVPGTPDQLLAGTLKTDDRVDVVANIQLDAENHAARIVLRDIRVLRAPEVPKPGARATGDGNSVLLAVRDTQVQRLFFVTKNADWSLELRPPKDATDSGKEVVETTDSVVNAGTGRTR
jgi:Flp pilus assembly protein CpaB